MENFVIYLMGKKKVMLSKQLQAKRHAISLKVFAIGLIIILLGVVHGLYVVAERHSQHQFASGSDYCNGEYTSTTIKATKLGTTLLMQYKLLINMGTATITIMNPSGEAVFVKTDDKHIIRQHAIAIDSEEELGMWTVSLSCKRADVSFELDLKVDTV
jgi:hypothetical protein